jgi:hypothetical protein
MNEIKAEALRLARVAAKADIKAQGLRLKDFELKEIYRLGEEWFAHHPELMEEAICLLFRRQISKHMHRNRGPEKSDPWAVQISSPKVEASK